MKPFYHKDTIVKIFSQLLNDIPGKIEIIEQGVMTYKYLVSINNKKYIIRFYPKGRENIVTFEPDIIRKCRALKMNVPTVYEDSRSGPKYGSNYMIYEFVEGVPLSSLLDQITTKQLQVFCDEVIRTIKAMTNIKIDGFGDLISKSQSRNQSWLEFIQTSFRRGLDSNSQFQIYSKGQISKLEQLRNMPENDYPAVEGRLVYSDLRAENIIIAPDMTLTAIIDFEGVLSGDPLLSLGYCYAANGDNLFFRTIRKSWAKLIGSINERWLDVYAILRGHSKIISHFHAIKV